MRDRSRGGANQLDAPGTNQTICQKRPERMSRLTFAVLESESAGVGGAPGR